MGILPCIRPPTSLYGNSGQLSWQPVGNQLLPNMKKGAAERDANGNFAMQIRLSLLPYTSVVHVYIMNVIVNVL